MLRGYEKLFRALGQTTRLKILLLLSLRELCVCELKAILQVSQPAVSQHLRILKEADLVRERRQGQWSFHSLNGKAIGRLGDFGDFIRAGPEAEPALHLDLARLSDLERNPVINCPPEGRGGSSLEG